MTDLHERIKNVRLFFERDLWQTIEEEQGWWRRFLRYQGQIWTVVLRDFFADRCMLRASALTFTTLLSIVPLLALMFAVLKGFGVQNALEPVLHEHLAVGSEDVLVNIIDYINNTNVGRLGTFGLLFLIVTVLTLLTNIEKSFNRIWGVEETRTILRRFTDYFSVVTIGPIFVVVAISMTSTVQSHAFLQKLLQTAYVGEGLLFLFKFLPFVVMWLVFAGLYLFMPNTKVDPRAALVGGVFGGTLWQLSQWAYVDFQVGVAKYNAIYGTMAALPIFMTWIYLSWMIVLLGLEITYATQNLRSIRQDIHGNRVNFASRELIALTVLVYLGRRFYRGEPALSHEEIAVKLSIPPRLLRSVLDELERLQLVSEVNLGQMDTAYQPAKALERIDLYATLRALADDGVDYQKLRQTSEHVVVASLSERLKSAEHDALAHLTLRDLVLDAEKREGGGDDRQE